MRFIKAIPRMAVATLLGGASLCLVPTPQGWKSCEQVQSEERSRNQIDCSLEGDDSYLFDEVSRPLLELMLNRDLEKTETQLDVNIQRRSSELRPSVPPIAAPN